MSGRIRKLIGTIILTIFLALYAFTAMLVSIGLQISEAGKLAEVVYYLIAGLAWVLPAGVIIWWMQKPDAENTPTPHT
ncbi:MAG: DUF2842 domain-containing protein [Pseudomonadota bacterium]